MPKPKRTEAERTEWRGRMQALAAEVRAADPEAVRKAWMTIGTVTCEGHHLSGFNMMFLARQAGRPLVQVGGCRQWNRIGRRVRKGERAAGYIYVPMTGKQTGSEAEGADGAERKGPVRFRLVPVFDVSQTEAAVD